MPGNWKKKTFVPVDHFPDFNLESATIIIKICLLWIIWPISVKRWKPVWIHACFMLAQKAIQLEHLSDMCLSNLEIGVAQLHSIMEIVLKSPLVNWFKPSLA